MPAGRLPEVEKAGSSAAGAHTRKELGLPPMNVVEADEENTGAVTSLMVTPGTADVATTEKARTEYEDPAPPPPAKPPPPPPPPPA
jgi:hypothetical protein